MKTSVMEVHDMLAVLSVDDVEKRIGEIPGVESVTVNFAGGNATVRFDETRLELADVKSIVRQRGFEPVATADDGNKEDGGHESHKAPDTPQAAPVAPAGGPAQQDQAAPSASAPASSPAIPDPTASAAPASPTDDEQKDNSEPDKS